MSPVTKWGNPIIVRKSEVISHLLCLSVPCTLVIGQEGTAEELGGDPSLLDLALESLSIKSKVYVAQAESFEVYVERCCG